jgi:hypothetical protein
VKISELTAGRKKQIAMALLCLVLVAVVVVKVLPGKATDSAAAARGPESLSLLDKDPGLLLSVASIARARARKVYSGIDLRDPMQPLIKIVTRSESPAPQAPAPVQLPFMTLHGVIWDPDNPIALIDGLDLRVGDKIKGARIVGIEFDSVSLTYRSKSFELTVD